MANPDITALFDLDGTLADFDGRMRQKMAEITSPGEPPWSPNNRDDEPKYLTNRRRLIKETPGFWANLNRLTDGFRVMGSAVMLGFGIMILSRGPGRGFNAWSEKVQWCKDHIACKHKITLTEDKGLVYGRVLVDDWPPYIKDWLEWRPNGTVIMPARSYNVDFVHPQVLRYIQDVNDEEMIDELKRQRARK